MSVPSGWYDDPENPENLRYWDGVLWTAHRQPKKSPTADQSRIGRAYPVAPASHPTGVSGTAPMDQPGPGAPPQSPWTTPSAGQGTQPTSGQPTQPSYGQPSYPPVAPMPGAYPPGAWAITGPTTPDGQPLAGWGTRLGAYLIDAIIASIVALPLTGYPLVKFIQAYASVMSDVVDQIQRGVADPVLPDTTEFAASVLGWLVWFSLANLLVVVLYQTFFLVRTGATPGKKLLGLAVRLRDKPGPLTVAVALRRQLVTVGSSLGSLIPVVSFVIALLPLVDGLWPLWDEKRQALHDKIAATNVVKTR
ncbi:MAG TPA: RDD family protein [Candidatus Lustribacter sp.]|nr:RDD family protein [Candidatus Lustribacter sp.]